MDEGEGYAWAEAVRMAVAAEVEVLDSEQSPRSVTVKAGVTEHVPTRRLWSRNDQVPLVKAVDAALVLAADLGGNCVARSSSLTSGEL
jgi:hypothetical protein